MELNFKIETLPVTIGEDKLELKTRDTTINEWIKETIKIQVENEDKSDEERGLAIMSVMAPKIEDFLKGLVVSGNKEALSILKINEQMQIIEAVTMGFHS